MNPLTGNRVRVLPPCHWDKAEGNATGATGVKSARGMRGHIFYFVGWGCTDVGRQLVGPFHGPPDRRPGVCRQPSHPAMTDQVIAAYAITWLLLLSGVRQAFKHGVGAKDAEILRDRTAIPRFIWALVWMAGTVGAVAVGGSMLVLHH